MTMARARLSRRNNNSSEEFHEDTLASFQFLAMTSPTQRQLPPEDELLRRSLSLHSPVSTTSSDAARNAEAQAQSSGKRTYRKIGAGACGAIFAADGDSLVYKLAKSSDYHEQVQNDFATHKILAEAFDSYNLRDQVRIPKPYDFVPTTAAAWFAQHPELESAAKDVAHFPTCLIIAERIIPLPQSTRELLIDKYCLGNKDAAKAHESNKDCLVRLYLGSLGHRSSSRMFSLRNYKLHLQQMVDLQLYVESFARNMGEALAVIHWAAQKDGRDIEFVLGSSPRPYTPDGEDTGLSQDGNFCIRTTEMFLLDFNQVQSITMDQDGVDKAVQAAMINDPYLPKPLQETAIEKRIWYAFMGSYLVKSEEILGKESELPFMFCESLTEAERQRQEKKKASSERAGRH